MKKTFNFGKIAYAGHKRINTVTIDVELRQKGGERTFTINPETGEKTITGATPTYLELSICGDIWNARKTDIVCGGQCLDTIAQYKNQLEDKDTFDMIYDLWRKYHLNSMHAGTPGQEAVIKAWEAEGNIYDYKAACDVLKQKGLYEVNYTGLTIGKRYNNEPYKYGHGWVIQELPGDVVLRVEHLLSV